MNDKSIIIRVDGTKYVNLRKLYLEKGTNVSVEIRKFIDSELAKIAPTIEIKTGADMKSQTPLLSQKPLAKK